MVHKASVLAVTATLMTGAAAQGQPWMQCGGYSWQGPTTCVEGYHCESLGPHYSQCQPGPGSSSSSTARSTIATSTTRPSGTATTATQPTGTGSGTNPGSTLVSGWYWIRGVAAPNYHSYLQTKPTGLASDAFLDAANHAGQYNVVSGQLVYNTGAGGELYMHVENPADKTQRKLETWFSKEKNDYGTFGFQGDTLTWHTSDIARPNEAAWLVCEGQQLFINTGAYLYNTPAGCADQTIHSYGGSTADV